MTRDHLLGFPPAAEYEAQAEEEARTDALWQTMRRPVVADLNPWVPLRITEARDAARTRMMRAAVEAEFARTQSPWNGICKLMRHTDMQGLAVDPRLTPKQRAWLARKLGPEDADACPL